MNIKQKYNAIALLQSIGGITLLETASSYAVAIFFGKIKDRNSINNGTMFFVDLGKGIIGITAAHVYNSYIEKKDTPNFICQIGGQRFEPQKYIIDINYDLDIATFRINPDILILLQKKAHTPISWPPTFTPKLGDEVFIAGFPAMYKGESGLNDIVFGSSMQLLEIDSINKRYISCKYSETTCITRENVPSNIFYGGISGAPLLLVHTTPIIHWSLCGIVVQASTDYGIIFASHAHYIQNDGTINKIDY